MADCVELRIYKDCELCNVIFYPCSNLHESLAMARQGRDNLLEHVDLESSGMWTEIGFGYLPVGTPLDGKPVAWRDLYNG